MWSGVTGTVFSFSTKNAGTAPLFPHIDGELGKQVDRLKDKDRLSDRQTQTDIPTDGQTERQTQNVRQTSR